VCDQKAYARLVPLRRVLLLGCVKQKRTTVQAAKDLYCSRLWKARRAFAEGSADPWFVVSALHGLVDAEEPIGPYDLGLSHLKPAERQRWGRAVVASLEHRFGNIDGMTFELHAGRAYRRILEPLLLAGGATVDAPTAAVAGVGAQIAWYSRHLPERRRRASQDEVAEALRELDEAPHVVRAGEWPGDLTDIRTPGLYSWWIDRLGAASLSAGLGAQLAEGRIYAGLTGATKWPSGFTGKNTLQKRVGRSHIRGRIRGSTFRLTLASVLREQLGLVATGLKLLAPHSEKALTEWICDHLSVAVHRFPADPLADLEHQVLARLDPPLNLDGMPINPLRMRLRELRHVLSHAPSQSSELRAITPPANARRLRTVSRETS
jgi:hypothetical protein